MLSCVVGRCWLVEFGGYVVLLGFDFYFVVLWCGPLELLVSCEFGLWWLFVSGVVKWSLLLDCLWG